MASPSPSGSGIRVAVTQGGSGFAAQSPDLFVIVRPPPSKQTHPLNLQIQLINPAARSNTYASTSSRTSGELSRSSTSTSNGTPMDSPSSMGGTSFDAVAGASVGGPGGLKRSGSVSSNRSGRSSSSVGSAFSSGTGGAGRRVQPLYNLEFHALLPTVVTDAGTDQKVAKFLKRGVDILGLAVLDPIDLAAPHHPLSPTASPPPPPTAAAESPSTFLGRFKRLSFKPSFSPSFSPSPSSSPSKGNLLSPSPSLGSDLTSSGMTVLPLLRTQSNSSNSPPRPVDKTIARGYAFLVRKWTRRDLESSKEGEEARREVRIEWRRASKRPKKRRPREGDEMSRRPSFDRRGSADSAAAAAKSRSPRRQTTLEGEELTVDPNQLCAPNGRRRSIGSRPNSVHSHHSHSDVDHSAAPTDVSGDEEDDGADSDPEDSERPWTCHLVQTPSSPASSPSSSATARRTHLGTLIPAPHHPKLVATLSVPYNLSPVALGVPQAGGTWGAREGLSVEEMKDVLSVSCLWVVVREGLGGLSAGGKGSARIDLKPKIMLKEGWKLGR